MTKDIRRMHRDHYAPPGPPDDHLPERVLCNVWSILELWVTRLRDQRSFKMVLVIFGNIEVLTEGRLKSSDIVQKSLGGFWKGFGVSRN
jgi:hypothetical protein